jgi:hypothetical protein
VRRTFDQNFKTIEDESIQNISKLNSLYRLNISKLKNKFQTAGNLQKYRTVEVAIEAFEKDPMGAVKTSTFMGDLDKLNAIYVKENNSIKKEKGTTILNLINHYQRVLLSEKIALVKSGKIDAATEVEAEEKRVLEISKEYLPSVTSLDSKLSQPTSSQIKDNPPANATMFETSSYKVFMAQISWQEAKKRCEKMGGTLACLETKKEKDWAARFAKGRVIWLGGGDYEKEGQAMWLNGRRVVVNFDKKGNAPHRDHLHFAFDGLILFRAESGYSPTAKFKHVKGFLCEWTKFR